MLKVQFVGKVSPEAVHVSIDGLGLKWKWLEEGIDLNFKTKIENSSVIIECELEKFEISYIGELYRRALDIARTSVNLVAFASGHGLTVYLERFVDPSGTSSQIIFPDQSLSILCTAYKLGLKNSSDFDAIYRIVMTNPAMFSALNDLIACITYPHCSLVNCGRVIDNIRRTISPNLNVGQGWAEMQKVLNISREYQEWISQQSTNPRHGASDFVSGEITTEVTHRTWAIMNRFLEYKKQGNQSLLEKDFPQLVPPPTV